ncbi:MAG: DMT family transporter [Beijerinckiaceae bacterium]|nr:DMT family transporter [Beijerinckiaceae bacterium]
MTKSEVNTTNSVPIGYQSRPDARATLIGIGLIVLNGGMWAASDTAAQLLTQTLPPIEVTWIRYLVHVIILFPLLRGGIRGAFRTVHLPLQVMRGVFAALSAITFIIGLNIIPVADATSVTFVAPFVIMGLAFALLNEHVEIRRWIAAAIGLSGVLIIVQPGSDAFKWTALLPLLAAILGAAAIITTRLMPHDDSKVTMVYTGFVGLFVLSCLLPFYWIMPSAQDALVGIAVGAFGAAANAISIIVYRRLPASLLAPFSYSQLVWASLFGFAVFGVWPTLATLTGALIIAGSGLYSAWRERQIASM